ncbi:MAG: CHRD domain-containing protein [Gemmatimonadota bacterium]|nr:MAG: CHRD domain-containing protein [Gemmatimonadota bacterium]
MQRGDAYVDLHTVYYAGGEIRGQIYPFVIPPPPPPPPPIFYATLSGANVVPPVKTEARGRARFELSSAGSGLYFKLEATRIERVTAAHIHLGVEGANGPIVAVLLGLPVNRPDPLTPSGPGIDWAPGIVVQGTLTDDDILPQPDLGFDGSLAALVSWMRRGAAYVVVRTVAHPTGEIRGQIRPEPQTCPDRDCETGG